MTTRLYYHDAYLTHFRARVLQRDDEGRRIVLDQTALYPTSGGQPHDLGTLAGVPVVEVVEEEDGRVAHLLAAPLPDGVAEVDGVVEWNRRFDHMQQHSGQHLLSAVFADLLGYETLSVHFGDDRSTLDLRVEELDAAALEQAERRANELVAENREVLVSFERAEAALGLRKPSSRTGELRVVSIAGVDRSACGGTHVRRTGEIGAVLLRRTERVRGATRVEFVCGLRAVRRARADHEALARTAQLFSAPLDAVPALVQAQREQVRALEGQLRRMGAELAAHRARVLYEEIAPDPRGVRRAIGEVVNRTVGAAAEDIRQLAHAFTSLPRTVLAAATDGAPATLFVAASEDSGVHAGAVLREALASIGGRGGGNPRLAQGSVPDRGRLAEVLALVERATGA